MRSTSSLVAFKTSDERTFAALHHDLAQNLHVGNPFDGSDLGPRRHGDQLYFFESINSIQLFPDLTFNLDNINYIHLNKPIQGVAFAYSGTRSVADVRITAVQEPKNGSFENSLSFLKTADTNLLANWIVSQNYRRLKAKEAGDLEYADQLDRSVRRIEKVVGEIIEDPSFGFVITAKDDDVRVRWQGVTVRLGVLPDGLQSIVSWIADLLMRLERVPWKDNMPVEQRQFLLLLDEIDIHLHPAWQRRVLPLVQRLFPNAQIIASTHSPFVVGSLADGRIISLGLQGGSAKVVHVDEPQLGVSYSAVLRSIFGIDSEFDVDTERKLHEFHAARLNVIKGDPTAQAKLDGIANELASRSEELREIVALELRQLQRQLALRATS
jgi:hypothetical protein